MSQEHITEPQASMDIATTNSIASAMWGEELVAQLSNEVLEPFNRTHYTKGAKGDLSSQEMVKGLLMQPQDYLGNLVHELNSKPTLDAFLKDSTIATAELLESADRSPMTLQSYRKLVISGLELLYRKKRLIQNKSMDTPDYAPDDRGYLQISEVKTIKSVLEAQSAEVAVLPAKLVGSRVLALAATK